MKYVGARYMPKFLGAYNNTTAYEALSVVDNGMGTSYVSNKPVPAGTPLTDTDYWAVYGMSSGAILNLQQQIDDMNDGTVPGSLQNQINDNTSNITALMNKVNNIKIRTPEEFGAEGDGINDDSAAIQDCLNNCQIAVFNGTYYITTQIDVPKGVSIIGTGTIKADDIFDYLELKGDNVIDGLTFTDTNTVSGSSGDCIHAIDTSNLTVTNCIFDTVGAGCCILFEHCEHITVEHNNFKDYGFSGIMLKATCKYASIQFNDLYNSRYMGSQHSYPICFSAYQLTEYGPAQYIKVNYNVIEEVTPHWEGIDSHGATDYEIIGNIITGTLSGMNLGSEPTSIAVTYQTANRNSIVKDNIISVASTDVNEVPYGIQVSEAANCTAYNVIIENNRISVSSANTATTAICAGISIRGGGGSSNCQIRNNYFYNLKNRHAIGFDYGKHENLVIDDNYVRAMTTDSPMYYMIRMGDVTEYDNIEISNNRMRNAFSGIGFFIGPNVAPTDNKLIEFRNNDDKGLSVSRINYSTYPDSSLPSVTKAKGIMGQFKPCSTTGTKIGWFCQSASNWVEVSGTVV